MRPLLHYCGYLFSSASGVVNEAALNDFPFVFFSIPFWGHKSSSNQHIVTKFGLCGGSGVASMEQMEQLLPPERQGPLRYWHKVPWNGPNTLDSNVQDGGPHPS